MGREINLMANYPRTKRDPMARAAEKTEDDRRLARQFGKDFFDGDRRCGYGGYTYHPRFWGPVMPDFISHFNLTPESSVLDVGCGKGFMLHDLRRAVPGITVAGIDISEYAIGQAMEDVRPFVQVADARRLPYPDHSFDVVISITTVHNFNREECIQALREIERVGRGKAFITLDAYRNEEERRMMEAWNLTAQTVLHVEDWKKLFDEAGYTGDYYWFMP